MPGLPKNSARQTTETIVRVGAIVMYEHDGAPLFGTLVADKGGKLTILNERSREQPVPRDRLHFLPGSIPPSANSVAEKASYLTSLRAQVERGVQEFKVEDLWSFTKDEVRDYTSDELTKLLHNSNELLPHAILRLALVHDKTYFKRNRQEFSPRPESIVEELRKQAEARARKLLVYGKFATTLQERQKDKNAPIPDQVGPVIRLLEEIAAESPRLDEGSFKEVKDLLGYLEEHLSRDMRGSREQVAYDLLTELGLFTVNTNLALLRYRPALTFSAHETAAALQIHVPQTLTEYPAGSLRSREDLTNLNCYTIDDESTQDMDDAISLEQTEEGYRLGIHISDVAALIPSGSPLDQAAHRRATSIYLPEQVIPMLPDGISHDRCSLVAGAVRPVTTVLIDVSPHFEIRGTQIVPAIIKVREKLSYDEVDRRLESHDRELEALYNITAAREGERLADGANNVGKRDAYVIIRGPHDLVLHEIDEQGAARTIVSELMILANTVFAQYAKRNGLPFLYRTQEGPDVSLDFLDEIPEGPARDYALRGKLKRSIMSTAPGRHSSLGLDLYTQMTSPIRRYADLLNQRQILSHLLDGKPQYTIDEIERIAFEVEEPLSHANFLSRESKRFWLLRYLEERLKREPITVTATVVRNDMKLPMVELDSLYITVPLRTDSRVALGEQCTVQVKEVSAFRDQVRLEVVR